MNNCPVCGGPLLKSGPVGESDRGYARCKTYPSHYKFEWSYMNSLITVRDVVFAGDRKFYNRRKSDKDPHDPLPENVKKVTDRLGRWYGYKSEEDDDE